jgi:hypothetical protein
MTATSRYLRRTSTPREHGVALASVASGTIRPMLIEARVILRSPGPTCGHGDGATARNLPARLSCAPLTGSVASPLPWPDVDAATDDDCPRRNDRTPGDHGAPRPGAAGPVHAAGADDRTGLGGEESDEAAEQARDEESVLHDPSLQVAAGAHGPVLSQIRSRDERMAGLRYALM